MANANKPSCPHRKNAAAQAPEKLVEYNELRRREMDLRWDEMNLGEKLFEAFVDFPHKAYLFCQRSIGEAVDFLRRKEPADKNAAVYGDRFSDNVYLNRAMMESDNAYHLRHGLSHAFQEKAADIRRRAFDECRNFGILQKTGQLYRINTPAV